MFPTRGKAVKLFHNMPSIHYINYREGYLLTNIYKTGVVVNRINDITKCVFGLQAACTINIIILLSKCWNIEHMSQGHKIKFASIYDIPRRICRQMN